MSDANKDYEPLHFEVCLVGSIYVCWGQKGERIKPGSET